MAKFRSLPLPTDSIEVQRDNKMAWNELRHRTEADFFTIGYTSRTIDDVIVALSESFVATVLDIRHNAVSMYRPEFSKSNLRRALALNGISYLHLPHLGVPRDVRSLAIGKETREDIWKWYDNFIVPAFGGPNLTTFFNLAEHPIALLCTELDPTSCHRHRPCDALERHGLRGFDL